MYVINNLIMEFIQNQDVIKKTFIQNGWKIRRRWKFFIGDGAKIVGSFIDDKKMGKCSYIFQDGKSYTGYWNDNNACGTGVYINPKTGGKESIIIN